MLDGVQLLHRRLGYDPDRCVDLEFDYQMASLSEPWTIKTLRFQVVDVMYVLLSGIMSAGVRSSSPHPLHHVDRLSLLDNTIIGVRRVEYKYTISPPSVFQILYFYNPIHPS